MTTPNGDVRAALETALDLHKAEPMLLDDLQRLGAMVLPSGMKLRSVKDLLAEYAPRPDRREGTVQVESLDSFIDYFNRFKNSDSVTFATEGRVGAGMTCNPKLVAVLDYHDAGGEYAGSSKARFAEHRAEYPFPVSDEWLAWARVNDRAMSLVEFAEFLEDHLADVFDPETAGVTAKEFAARLGLKLATPARLLELSKGLEVHASHVAAQASSLLSGEGAIQFSEKHGDAKGMPLSIPGGFVLGIPVFRLGKRYQVCVRLRYRVKEGGAIVWICKLHRTDLVFEDAFAEACKDAAEKTGQPLYRGVVEERATPEDAED